jgi:hypothetical protein
MGTLATRSPKARLGMVENDFEVAFITALRRFMVYRGILAMEDSRDSPF